MTCKHCKGTGIEWVMIAGEPEKDLCRCQEAIANKEVTDTKKEIACKIK